MFGLSERLFGEQGPEGIQRRVERLDAAQEQLDQLAWADLPGSHQLSEFARARKGNPFIR